MLETYYFYGILNEFNKQVLTFNCFGIFPERHSSCYHRVFGLLVGVLLFFAAGVLNAQYYTSSSSTDSWNSRGWSPFNFFFFFSYSTNSDVTFTASNYSFDGMGTNVNVGNITLNDNVNVTFTANTGTFSTGNNVRTLTVGAGSVLNFADQNFTNSVQTGFIKNGAGTVALKGNSYGGGFTLNQGTAISLGNLSFGSGSSNTLALNGGIVASDGDRTFLAATFAGGITVGGNIQFGEFSSNNALASSSAGLSFASSVALGGAARTFTLGNNGAVEFSGTISNSGSGGITFTANTGATGRFDISGSSSTFSGPIAINGGEVRIASNGSLGNATNSVTVDGGRFGAVYNTSATMNSSRTLYLGDGSGTTIITPGASAKLTVNGTITNKAGQVGTLRKQGAGVLEIGAAGAYSGETLIQEGTIRLTSGSNRLPTGTVVRLGQTGSSTLGKLDLNGLNQEIAGLNSVIGTSSVGDNTVTTASAATLRINVSGNHSFGDGTNSNSGVITGPVSLLLVGSGKQTLGDTNTYSGTTNVQSGTLEVNGNQSGATGAVSIGNGGTLAGTGTIGGNTTVQTGGNLSGGLPGTVGTLSFTGNLTTGTGSHWLIDLVQNVNGSSDLINVSNGGLNISGSVLDLAFSGAHTVGNFYQIASFNPSLGLTGTFSGLAEGSVVSNYQINYGTVSAGAITLTAVPEPGTLVILACGVLGVIAVRTCRKRGKNAEPDEPTFCESGLSSSALPVRGSLG